MKMIIKIILLLLANISLLNSASAPPEIDTSWKRDTARTLTKVQRYKTSEAEHKKPKHQSHFFFGRRCLDYAESRGITYEQILRHRHLALDASIKTLSDPQAHLKESEPQNTHWHLVWITNPDNPHPMPYLESIAANMKLHQDLYTFHIWSNTSLQEEKKELEKAGAQFYVHPLEDVTQHQGVNKHIEGIIQRLIKARYYSFACNVLRVALVHHYGEGDAFNVYTDLGLQFHQRLDPHFLRYFNQFSGFLERDSLYPSILDIGNYFFGGKKANKMTTTFLQYLIDGYMAKDVKRFEKEIKLCNPPFGPFMAIPSFISSYDGLPPEESSKTLFLPVGETSLLTWRHLSSWRRGTHGQKCFPKNPITAATFFGTTVQFFTKDWLPPYPKIVWEYASLALKDTPDLRVLEVGPWEGRDTVHIIDHLLARPNATLEVIDWWKPYKPGFNVQGAYHRFINNTEKALDERKLIITREHPGKKLPLLKQKITSGEKHPYHFIHVRFLHEKKTGYMSALQHAFALLQRDGLLLTPCDMWQAHGYLHLQEVAKTFLAQNQEQFDLLAEGPYLCLRKK